MGKTFQIDTNVFIDYMGRQFSDNIFNDVFHYSIISRMEFLGYYRPSHAVYQSMISFLNVGEQYDVDSLIGNQVIEMRPSLTKNNLPDTIIAVTAIVNDFTLLTNNTKHFQNIPGLKFENPWDWQ